MIDESTNGGCPACGDFEFEVKSWFVVRDYDAAPFAKYTDTVKFEKEIPEDDLYSCSTCGQFWRRDANRMDLVPDNDLKAFAKWCGPPTWGFDPDGWVEDFFDPLEDTIDEFCVSHNLMLTNHDHDGPIRSLTFSHPMGGNAGFQLSNTGRHLILAIGSWWEDDFDNLVQHHYQTEFINIPKEPSLLTGQLELLLAFILNLNTDNCQRDERDFSETWGKMSREQFETTRKQYPDPIL